MFKDHVQTPGDALLYSLDCTLATVDDMAMKKSRPKGEYRRQIAIAQGQYDWVLGFNINMAGTRAEDVRIHFNGSVADYAKEMEA